MVLDPETSAKITRYRPKHAPPLWADIAPLVRSVVAAVVTAAPYDVERLLHVTGRLALWAEAAGLERDPNEWLRNEVIDAFVRSRAGDIKGSSVRTYRTWLLRVRDALAWSERGEAAPARMHAEGSRISPTVVQSSQACGTGPCICLVSRRPMPLRFSVSVPASD
ncbi:hypothetical protein DEJ50_33400 [Streptomyces venezuelae]|uniref:Uncharacterized protein n=1 Tax=Streptomyces venezuelae TaxID=54571 RepID=A0A5P2DCR4_STRVZ|nr:hypothetical protein DEJ50_33400 [Streptomyces venezuelae]